MGIRMLNCFGAGPSIGPGGPRQACQRNLSETGRSQGLGTKQFSLARADSAAITLAAPNDFRRRGWAR